VVSLVTIEKEVDGQIYGPAEHQLKLKLKAKMNRNWKLNGPTEMKMKTIMNRNLCQ
jgi:hypothetical protein